MRTAVVPCFPTATEGTPSGSSRHSDPALTR
jgi:hypothetical protein